MPPKRKWREVGEGMSLDNSSNSTSNDPSTTTALKKTSSNFNPNKPPPPRVSQNYADLYKKAGSNWNNLNDLFTKVVDEENW